jgi:hypothetical protein
VDYLEAGVQLVQGLRWPIVTLVIIYWFQRGITRILVQISERVGNLKKLRAFGAQADFDVKLPTPIPIKEVGNDPRE